ncbi:hypothetical protein JTL48_27480 [Pseudomonas aeruginosa]|nr:hypothetical protein [Pseudomonas aeruginosa]MBN0195193.1 hypothetical protein [Pseudomonas aeruginosa]MBN1002971.1 hypothetical protein [Pseudomonas aeruginosa]HBO6993352.1 hypothetical protein [Pseudomonas aeruginosa]
MELVRYGLTDPCADAEYVRKDLENMIAIANELGATRFQGFSVLRDVVQFEKQGDRWEPGPMQLRSLSYEDVCGHYQRILSEHPGCGLQVARYGLVFHDDDGRTLLRAPFKHDGTTIDEDEILELDGDEFYYGCWAGETPEKTRQDILSPVLKSIPDLEEILSRNNSRSFF